MQGKATSNQQLCNFAVLAVAVGQRGAAQVIPFKSALTCIRALVDFNIRVQYKCYTPESIAYKEDGLDQLHTMKDIFLKFRVIKHILAKVHRQQKSIHLREL